MSTFQFKDQLEDSCIKCRSILTHVKVKDYVAFIEEIFSSKGGLEGQRAPLTTKSAKLIRERMVEDLRRGAVIPPIVIGYLMDHADYSSSSFDQGTIDVISGTIQPEKLSIIDGMQRTTALKEGIADIEDKIIRVEFCVSENIQSLIYRMIILNTGQVPWTVKRQLETVFESLSQYLTNNITDLNIIKIDDSARRSQPGQYQGSDVVDMYLCFGERSEKIDPKERLANELSNLDFAQSASFEKFESYFIDALKMLIELDQQFSRVESEDRELGIKKGFDIFTKQASKVGFIAAIAQEIFGRPGAKDRDPSDVDSKMAEVKSTFNIFIARLAAMDDQTLRDFIEFDTLSQSHGDLSKGRKLDLERKFFLSSFKTLIQEKFEVENLGVCWREF